MIFKHLLILRFVFSLCIQSHLFICVFHACTIVCSRKLTCKAKVTELIRKTQQQKKKKGKKRKIKKNLVSRCSQLRSSKGNLLACFRSHASACIPFQTSSLACFFFLACPLRISSSKVASTAVLMCFVTFQSPTL